MGAYTVNIGVILYKISTTMSIRSNQQKYSSLHSELNRQCNTHTPIFLAMSVVCAAFNAFSFTYIHVHMFITVT